MECKKCGCDTLIKTDDWYKCANCGAVIFDTDVTVNDVTSPTKRMEKIDCEPQPSEDIPTDEAANADETMPEVETEEKNKRKPSKLKELVDFCLPILIAVIIAMLLKSFVFANCIVPSGSMLNTLQIGDRIIASRLAYINNDPERYDVVVFEYPDKELDPQFMNDDKPVYFVKRVIGLPGETVEIVNGVTYVTTAEGKVLQLDDSFITNCQPYGNYGPFTVPEGCYFMMGDNRNDSHDSRFWENKFVQKDKIIGKTKLVYFSRNGNMGTVK